jgi:hypothetical protein
MRTGAVGFANVGRAGVAIIAQRVVVHASTGAETHASDALVWVVERIAVVARQIVIVQKHATENCVAIVDRAGVAIITVGLWSGDTRATVAGVVRRAGVVVVTGRRVERMFAAVDGIARIGRAGVAVVTIGRHPGTSTGGAIVLLGTGVAIIAWITVVGVRASGRSVTVVIGASVAVVAIEGRVIETRATVTSLVDRTSIAVIARIGIVDVDATTD